MTLRVLLNRFGLVAILSTVAWSFSVSASCPTLSPYAGDVIFNEVQFHGENSKKDWFELYTNHTDDDNPININGWTITLVGSGNNNKLTNWQLPAINQGGFPRVDLPHGPNYSDRFILFTDDSMSASVANAASAGVVTEGESLFYSSDLITDAKKSDEFLLHNTLQEMLLTDADGNLVYYLRYENKRDSKKDWIFSCDESYENASDVDDDTGNDDLICTKQDGVSDNNLPESDEDQWDSVDGPDGARCLVSPGSSNNPDEQVHHFELVYSPENGVGTDVPVTIKACVDASCSGVVDDPNLELPLSHTGTDVSMSDATITGFGDDGMSDTTVTTDTEQQFAFIHNGDAPLQCYDLEGNAIASCQISFFSVDHYELVHAGVGYTCGAADITVKACKNAACSSLSSFPTSLQISSSDGNLSASNLSFTGSTSVSLTYSQEGTVTIAGSNGDPDKPVSCVNSGTGGDCELTFTQAGLNVSYGDSSSVVSIPDQDAQSAIGSSIYVTTSAGANCGANLEGVTLQLAMQCQSPGSCNSGMLSLGGNTIGDPASYTDTSITFNANGVAEIPAGFIRYDDAGEILLSARAADGTALGVSNSFMSLPELQISHNAGGPQKAGETFELMIQAVGELGDITPNYQPGDMDISLRRRAPSGEGVQSNLVWTGASLESRDDGVFSPFNESVLGFSNGVSTTDVYMTDVGEYELTVRDSNYQGNVLVSNTTDLGLFTPAYFDVSVTGGSLDDQGTDGFRYLGDTFSFDTDAEITVTAKNALGATTLNYAGVLWNLGDLSSSDWTVTDSDYQTRSGLASGSELLSNLTSTTSGQNTYDGVTTYSLSGTVTYLRPGSGEVAPGSDALTIDINASAFEHDYSVYTVCYDSSYPSSCAGTSLQTDGDVSLRHGRATLSNAYGPDDEDLPVPLSVEYWDGTEWTLNDSDNTTSYNSDDITLFDPSDGSTWSVTSVNDTGGNVNVSGGEPVTPVSGIVLQATGSEVQTGVSWDVPAYLEYDWDGDGSADDDPQAQASFGRFRSNDRIIHWREVN